MLKNVNPQTPLGKPLDVLDEYYQYEVVERYGPLPIYWPPTPPDVAPIDTAVRVRRTRPYVEVRQSGFRTAMIIYKSMAESLASSLTDAAGQAWQLTEALDMALRQVSTYLTTGQSDEGMAFDPETLGGIDADRLKAIEQAVVNLPIPAAARNPNWPHVMYYAPDADAPASMTLTDETVLWREQNLVPRLIPAGASPPPPVFWDEERFSLTINNPAILAADGLPQDEAYAKIDQFMAEKQTSVKPVLVVLTTAFANAPSPIFEERTHFYLLYLPAPPRTSVLPPSLRREAARADKEALLPVSLSSLAEAVGAQIHECKGDKEHDPIAPDVLGQTAWCVLDRQRVALAAYESGKESVYVNFPGEWEQREAAVFTLPSQWRKVAAFSLTEVGKAIRWRAELADGFVAGAAAAFYRAGQALAATSEDDIVVAVSTALQEPLKTLLQHIPDREPILQQVATRPPPYTVKLTDDPQEIEAAQKNPNQDLFQSDPVGVIGGDARELGLVTPLPEIDRSLRQARELLLVELIQLGVNRRPA